MSGFCKNLQDLSCESCKSCNPVYNYLNIKRTPPLTNTGGPTVNTGVLLISYRLPVRFCTATNNLILSDTARDTSASRVKNRSKGNK